MAFLHPMRCLCLALLVAGCGTLPRPDNLPQAQYQLAQHIAQESGAACLASEQADFLRGLTPISHSDFWGTDEPIGAGDRLKLIVSGDSDIFSGTYAVGGNGQIALASVGSIKAAGRAKDALEGDIRHLLISQGFIQDIPQNVQIAQIDRARILVSVEGAVFEPGLVEPNEIPAAGRADSPATPVTGEFNAARSLFAALRAAGGIRPDADAQSIYVVRGAVYTKIDISPVLLGGFVDNPHLVSGDRIIVPTRACFNPDYVRPSRVTPSTMRIYLSNLARPVSAPRDGSNMPYGTRFLQGLIAANCVGGSAMNSGRTAILVSRNPLNGQSVVISRSVEHVLRASNRDQVDPYLMPGDAIACYDSNSMALVDAVGVVGSLLSPAILFGIR